ncbi:hypothetical protein ON010_g13264 [Phytophthora cinnamomi]|nr:hypothetical protein ON010_g13264 [Phytophthora cinnamomi]
MISAVRCASQLQRSSPAPKAARSLHFRLHLGRVPPPSPASPALGWLSQIKRARRSHPGGFHSWQLTAEKELGAGVQGAGADLCATNL